MLRMEHPNHGAMHVRNEAEAKYNMQFGWKVVPEPEPKKPVARVEEDEVVKLKEEYFNVFGKKPHHLMTTKSIKKALNGNS